MNYLYIDCEYSNFNIQKGDLIQLAMLPIVNGVKESPFIRNIRPENRSGWTEGAEKVHGISWEKAQGFESKEKCAEDLTQWLDKIDCFFTCVGWNCRNDQLYVEKLVRQTSIFNCWHLSARASWVDLLPIAKRELRLKSHTLSNVAKHFHIEFKNAHDAAYDAMVTYEIHQRLASQKIDSYEQAQISGEQSLREIRNKAMDSKYLQMDGKTVYISEHATSDPSIMKAILDELHSLYVDQN